MSTAALAEEMHGPASANSLLPPWQLQTGQQMLDRTDDEAFSLDR
jgi:hypothetical protein